MEENKFYWDGPLFSPPKVICPIHGLTGETVYVDLKDSSELNGTYCHHCIVKNWVNGLSKLEVIP